MATKFGGVWAIDIGNSSLKALQLSDAGGALEVVGFANIEHTKILSGTSVKPAERDELTALSLHQFVTENNVGKKDIIIISMPSQNSFARFVNLPPVEQKRIPEIVKFEASQQIPFDISEVQWDWQMLTETDSGQSRVGIFAIKNDVVNEALKYFTAENLQIRYVQMAPMALYNYLLYDRPDLTASDTKATVILNIGAENTDLVVCTKSTPWQRAIPMGGNAFTMAIADAFKLNFQKAEKLKRTAPMSKYARQILQAMKPVFSDLSSEIQRSLGFYTNSNPNTQLSRIIAFGGGTKMRGLLKYLQQSLQIPVERPDSFKNLTLAPNVSAAKFHENVSDFGIVYGLGVQGLGLGKIESNLLPRSAARSMAWANKSKYFVAAACMLLLVSVLSFARALLDRKAYGDNSRVRQEVRSLIQAANESQQKLTTEESKTPAFEATIQKQFEYFQYRDVVPRLTEVLLAVLPNKKNNPGQSNLYRAFADGDAESILEIPRKKRKQMFITNMSIQFTSDVETTDFSGMTFTVSREKTETEKAIEQQRIMEIMMEGAPSSARSGYRPSSTGRGIQSTEQQGKPGFLVSIAGYSPYENMGELMDPPGVKEDSSKWGVITRLMHPDDIVDGNCPFELFSKTDSKHFQIQTGEVDPLASMPEGIGLAETPTEKKSDQIKGVRSVLVDPMTKEIISRVPEMNEYGRQRLDRLGKVMYEVNDHWFALNMKFVWKNAPKRAAP
ncbi:MAG TPA: type IV pilus assembly protein PilM [Sedimentisphaerales bacterium]|nr:type IV pilus assembly protein PilM [Sedimentisphaerales bacterium]